MIASRPTKVVLLRQPERAAEWRSELERHGFTVIVRSVTRTRFIRPACPECWLKAVEVSDWIAFTSVNAVDALFAGLKSMVDAGALLRSRHVAAIGPASSRRLVHHGVPAEICVTGTSSDLGKTLVEQLPAHSSVLHPGAREGLRGWLTLLKAAGHRVRHLPCYVTEPIPVAERAVLEWNDVDVAVVAAPSTVRALMMEPTLPSHLPIIAIGPTTARRVRECGLNLWGVAETPSARGIAELLDGAPGAKTMRG